MIVDGLNPYGDYKPSRLPWLDRIPAHWEENRAKGYFREVDERSQTGEEELLSVSHLTGVTPLSQKNVTMFKAESYVGHKRCLPGDLVINPMAALGVAKQTGLVSPSYATYRLRDPNSFIPEFVDALLRTQPYRFEYICRSTGIRSSRLRLYPEKFLDIPIVQPPRHEQIAATDYLNRVGSLVQRFIRAKRRQLEVMDDWKRSKIDAFITRGSDAPSGLTTTSVGEFPNRWRILPLKRCVSVPITDGPTRHLSFLTPGWIFSRRKRS